MSLLGWTAPNGAKVTDCRPSTNYPGKFTVSFDKSPLPGADGLDRVFTADGKHYFGTLPGLVAPSKLVNMTDKYVTRSSGAARRVLCLDGPHKDRPVIVVDDDGSTSTRYPDGRMHADRDNPHDLVLAPLPDFVTYANVYGTTIGAETGSTSSLARGSLGLIRITRSPDRQTVKSVEIVR